MEIEIQTTRKDYLDFLRYYYLKRNIIAKIIIPLPIILLISYNTNFRDRNFWGHFLFTFLVLGFLFFLFRFLLPYLISMVRLTKQLKKNTSDLENNRISLLDNGINIAIESESKFCNWQSIKSIGTYNSYIYLALFDNHFYLFPKNAFHSDGERITFFNSIQNEILKAKPQNVNRLYNRGWLGLIPLVGAFVGIWLINQGISKYKDKKLIIVGIASVLFTVAIYSSMFYYFQYSKQFSKDFSVFSQPYMNTLVKSIEFYTIQNGSYPDSLEEITYTDKMVMIHDPILSGKPTINEGLFYYKKIGNKYSLFSSGVDRIPYTEDDILPSSNLFDSTKTGLIRENR